MSSFFPHIALKPSQGSKDVQLQLLLEASEQRILAEFSKIKDELIKEVRSSISKLQTSVDSQYESEEVPLSNITTSTASALQFPLFGAQSDGLNHELVQSESQKSNSSNWMPEDPGFIMGSYIALGQEARGAAGDLTADVSYFQRTVRRFPAARFGLPDSYLATTVASQNFDCLASCCIALNAVFIGLEVHMTCKYPTDMPQGLNNTFRIGGNIFLVIFCLEWMLRVTVAGFSFFSCNSVACHWNWLDTLSVFFQVMDRIYDILRQGQWISTPSVVSFMRLIRLLRIFRVLRLLHLSDELGMLAHAIARSLSTVCWALVLMIIILYAFSVAFTERIWKVKQGNVHGKLAYYFSDVPRTMLTLTESVLGGLSWDETVWLLFSEVGWLSGSVFVFFVILGLFILCNVVTGVFNEGVSKSAEQEESRQIAVRLQIALGMGDPDLAYHQRHSMLREQIAWEEFRDKVLHDPHMQAYFISINIDPTEFSARKVFEFLDVNNDRVLTRGELFYGCLKLREPARTVDVSLIMHNMEELKKAIECVILNTNRVNRKMAACAIMTMTAATTTPSRASGPASENKKVSFSSKPDELE